MPTPVVCPRQPLPRSLDVEVNLSRPQTEIATDMSLMCFLTDSAPFPPNAGRVRYYSSMAMLEADFPMGTEGWWAGNAFFSRQLHPLTMAVGAVFMAPVAAGLMAGDIDYAALAPITNGAFDLEVDETLVSFEGLDFTSAPTTPAEVAAILEAAAPIGVEVAFEYGALTLKSTTTGDDSTIGYAAEPSAGTDVGGFLGLTPETGAQKWSGYAPGGLPGEAAMVQTASRCNGRAIYGWTIDKKWRDTQAQKDLADWAEAQLPAWFSACTNSVTAFNVSNTTNIGYYGHHKGYTRTSVIYHDNPQIYPDVSYMALALSVDYAQTNSTLTMKFKMLDGMEVSVLTESQAAALDSRHINYYVAIGNTARTVRQGVQCADTWFTDSRVNLDNFVEELQVEVLNVFLRRRKVPYTNEGQDLLISAASKICARYTRNGTFAPRDVEAPETELGFLTEPGYNIIPAQIAFSTTSERASRVAPPIAIVAYEAGAIHRVVFNIDVFN